MYIVYVGASVGGVGIGVGLLKIENKTVQIQK